MNDIFLMFLSLSLSGSLVAFLLCLLKPIIKDLFSKTWQYYILLIVVARFLLPFSSDTSLMGMVFHQTKASSVVEKELSAMPPGIQFMQKPHTGTTNDNQDERAAVPFPFGQMVSNWMWAVWLVPAVMLLFKKAAGYFYLMRLVKKGCAGMEDARIWEIYREECKAMKLRHCPCLAKNEKIAAPILIGTFRPVIVLPDAEWKEEEIRYIIQHELTHHKRLDIVYKWFVQVMVCLHWFNPVAYWICREVNRSCELSCDEAVIRRLDKNGKYAYGDMLLSSIKLDKMTAYAVVSISLSEDTKLIKERLKAIMKHKKKSRNILIVSVFVAAVVLCGAAFSGVYPMTQLNQPSQYTDMPQVQEKNNPDSTDGTQPSSIARKEVPVSIEEMEMRYYEDKSPDGRWPYLHWVISNNSNRTISDFEMVCLAYNKDGKPLELIWKQFALTNDDKITGFTPQMDKSYEQSIALSEISILPGEKQDLNGGWSLWDGWDQENGTHKVAYVLACMKQVTFEDGTVWENPEYETWLSVYKGKEISPYILGSYYPYE